MAGLELGVGRGGVFEAFFWGQDSDVEINAARYVETLQCIQDGLSHAELTHHGEFLQLRRTAHAATAPAGPLSALLVYAERGNRRH